MIRVDLEGGTVVVEERGLSNAYALSSAEAFRILSAVWLRCGWDNKYVYSFTWQGRPIIQLPDDLLRLQEWIYAVKPDVILETGVAHGGGLIFYASLCKVRGKGRVVGIDIEIRPHNRRAIEAHELSPFITLIEGNSVAPEVVAEVRKVIRPSESVMVLLDSCHSKAHVLAELEAYAPFVTKDSIIVAMDGIMQDLVGAPRSQPDWNWNNPQEAAREFLRQCDDFVLCEPPLPFNEGNVKERVTYWPNSVLRRIR